jgi:hypothetical protein
LLTENGLVDVHGGLVLGALDAVEEAAGGHDDADEEEGHAPPKLVQAGDALDGVEEGEEGEHDDQANDEDGDANGGPEDEEEEVAGGDRALDAGERKHLLDLQEGGGGGGG